MKLNKQLSDVEVIERVLAGECSLYELIVRRYNPYLYKLGRSYNYNHEDTEDLMQEVYVDVFKALHSFEGKANFKTWISRIMLNNCFKKKEKSSFKNEITKDMNENFEPLFHHSSDETASVVHNRELGHIIEDTLKTLQEEYRMVFALREINGMDIRETAEALNISESNVKARLSRAKEMLREKLEKSYSSAELYEYHAVFCDPMTANVMKLINQL